MSKKNVASEYVEINSEAVIKFVDAFVKQKSFDVVEDSIVKDADKASPDYVHVFLHDTSKNVIQCYYKKKKDMWEMLVHANTDYQQYWTTEAGENYIKKYDARTKKTDVVFKVPNSEAVEFTKKLMEYVRLNKKSKKHA